jgi:Alpha-L-arabinofuranosidase 1 domain/3-keto-disaccharide hydrolase/Alpha-L-arabinofuranosidase C-terminal domain
MDQQNLMGMSPANSHGLRKLVLPMFMKFCSSLTAVILPFALLSPADAQSAKIQVNAKQITSSISPYLGTGACLEDVNHEVYGGIYSQMLFGESFQEPSFMLVGFRDYGGGNASVSGTSVTLAPNSTSTDEKLIWAGGNFAKATVSVQVLRPSSNPGTAGFILDVQNPSRGPDQFYGYEISLNGSQLVIGQHQDAWIPLATYPCNTPTDQWVTLEVQFQDDSFQVSVNGTLVATYVDQQYPLSAGMIGLRSFGGNASFQQFSVTTGSSTTQVQFVPAGPSNAVSDMWTALQTGSATGSYMLSTNAPFVGAQSQQVTFTTGLGTVGVYNQGLNRWGLNFVKNKPYDGEVWVQGQPGTTLYVDAESADGSRLYDEAQVQIHKSGWQKLTFALSPNQNDQDARFSIKLKSPGTVTLGYAFLQPGTWGQFKNLPVRGDVANGLLTQGVRVLRYGGSMINATEYRWKQMIGPSDRRQPYVGTWYPYSSNGWAIFEFLNFCEQAGFLGIPALNSNETPQDMADFIQYANGPATSEWGKKRAQDGHPEPYNLKYFEFGNEETIDDAYWQKFEAMAKSVWGQDPNVVIVVGDFSYSQPIQNPFNFTGAASGITSLEAQQKILHFAQQNGKEVWFDVHINTTGPGADPTLIALPTYVSALDQVANGAAHQVVVFELNADIPTQSRAVGNGLAINAITRIPDQLPVVTSANCLQPDKENDNGWDQGLLFLNPYEVWLQPPGYVTQLVSDYYQPNLVASTVQSPGDVLDVIAKKSADSKKLILQVVNISGEAVATAISLSGFSRSQATVIGWKLSADINAENTAQQPNLVIPVQVSWNLKPSAEQTSYTFDPYSVTILTFQ